MSENIDKAAHDLMNFKPQRVTRVHGYEVFYHEERLYTVRDSNTGITSLVYAREPREAAEKVIKMTVCGRLIKEHPEKPEATPWITVIVPRGGQK